jgi:hypothetical protein
MATVSDITYSLVIDKIRHDSDGIVKEVDYTYSGTYSSVSHSVSDTQRIMLPSGDPIPLANVTSDIVKGWLIDNHLDVAPVVLDEVLPKPIDNHKRQIMFYINEQLQDNGLTEVTFGE